jgi:hypothetical protein
MTGSIALAALLLVPNALRLERARPGVAAALWLSSLVLRALLVTLAAVSLLALVPGTLPFELAAGWCWKTVLPIVDVELYVSGVRLVQGAIIAPMLVLVGWALLRVVQIARSHRFVRQRFSSGSLGQGPLGSVIVGGPDVMLAAIGLVRPTVVLSAGALARLDDEELEAAIAHEQGHIYRQHRWWIALAEVCASVARMLPGTNNALRQFKFHVERDADHWAVARTGNPLALASAICKSTLAINGRGVLALGGVGAVDRVDQLLDASPDGRMDSAGQKLSATLATVLILTAIAFASAVPTATASGVKHLEQHAPPVHVVSCAPSAATTAAVMSRVVG